MPGLRRARERMIEKQLERRGIADLRVLAAMASVPREEFVPDDLCELAYEDRPLPIGFGQTISQPYVVALMLEAAALRPDDRTLEIGAGSGYAAAVMSRLVGRVFAIERHGALANLAAERLARLGFSNIEIKAGDGTVGWPEQAPFDAILAAAGGPDAPLALKAQLAMGGRLVMPIGVDRHAQTLVKITRLDDGGFSEESLGEVRFVPLIGEQGWTDESG